MDVRVSVMNKLFQDDHHHMMLLRMIIKDKIDGHRCEKNNLQHDDFGIVVWVRWETALMEMI